MTGPTPDSEPFLSRWSRLKRARAGSADAAAAVPLVQAAVVVSPAQPAVAPPPAQPVAATQVPAAAIAAPEVGNGAALSLPSIDLLTIESDYAQFFQPKVPEALRRAAVKKLFADPHFNVMDGLDTYIDDYSKADPIPPEMLARLVQARDIIDHPSDRKPEDIGSAPSAAAIESADEQATVELPEEVADRQPDAPAAVEPPEGVAARQWNEQAAVDQPEGFATGQTEEHVTAGGPRAAAPEGRPTARRPAKTSADISSDVFVVSDTPAGPAGTAV